MGRRGHLYSPFFPLPPTAVNPFSRFLFEEVPGSWVIVQPYWTPRRFPFLFQARFSMWRNGDSAMLTACRSQTGFSGRPPKHGQRLLLPRPVQCPSLFSRGDGAKFPLRRPLLKDTERIIAAFLDGFSFPHPPSFFSSHALPPCAPVSQSLCCFLIPAVSSTLFASSFV